MIVLSFLLVIVAAVALVVGLFLDSLGWIWASIASCLLALLFLGVGVLQRRGAPASAASDEDEYAGAVGRVVETGPDEERAQATEEVAVVPKRTVRDAQEAIEASDAVATVVSRPEPEPQAEAAEEPEVEPETVAAAPTKKTAAKKKAAKKSTKKAAAKKSTKKAAKKAAAKKSTKKAAATEPAKKTAKKSTKKAAAKKATKKAAAKKAAKKSAGAARKTTGAAARRELAEIKGLGEAKANALLAQFGSLEAIRAASVDELTAVKGIGETTADEIRGQL